MTQQPSPRGGGTTGPIATLPTPADGRNGGASAYFTCNREVDWRQPCEAVGFPYDLWPTHPAIPTGYYVDTLSVRTEAPNVIRRASALTVRMGHDVAAPATIQFLKWNPGTSTWDDDGDPVNLVCRIGGFTGEENLLRHWLLPGKAEWTQVLPFLPCRWTVPDGWQNTVDLVPPVQYDPYDFGNYTPGDAPTITDADGYTVEPLKYLLPTGGVTVTPKLTHAVFMQDGGTEWDYLSDNRTLEDSLWLFFDGPVIPGEDFTDTAVDPVAIVSGASYVLPKSGSKRYHTTKFPNVVRLVSTIRRDSFASTVTLGVVASTFVTAADGTPIGSNANVVVEVFGPAPRYAPSYGPGIRDDDGRTMQPLPPPNAATGWATPSNPHIWDDGATTQKIGAVPTWEVPSVDVDGSRELPIGPPVHQFNLQGLGYNVFGGVYSPGGDASTAAYGVHNPEPLMYVRAIVDNAFQIVGDRANALGTEPSMTELTTRPGSISIDAVNCLGLRLAEPLPSGYMLDPSSTLRVYNLRTKLPVRVYTMLTVASQGGWVDSNYNREDPVGVGSLVPPYYNGMHLGNAAPTACQSPAFVSANEHYLSVLQIYNGWPANQLVQSYSSTLLWVADSIVERAGYTNGYTGLGNSLVEVLPCPATERVSGEQGLLGTRHGWQVGDEVLVPVRHCALRTKDGILPVIAQPMLPKLAATFLPYSHGNASGFNRLFNLMFFPAPQASTYDGAKFSAHTDAASVTVYDATPTGGGAHFMVPLVDYILYTSEQWVGSGTPDPDQPWNWEPVPQYFQVTIPAAWTAVATVAVPGGYSGSVIEFPPVYVRTPVCLHVGPALPSGQAFTLAELQSRRTKFPVAIHDNSSLDRIIPGVLLPGNDHITL